MEEKLGEILNEHYKQIDRYNNKREALLSRIGFCQAHNFKEEERIARVEYDAMDMIVYNYNNLYKEVRELLNDWVS